MQFVAAAQHSDRDVVGLDVAVRDALVLQMVHDLEQVLAEPLEQVDVQPAVLSQPLAQGLDDLPVLFGEDGSHQECRTDRRSPWLDEAHDALMTQSSLASTSASSLIAGIILGSWPP